MKREIAISLFFALALPVVALIANQMGETFYISLVTRIAVLALAATGLNLVLGLGGMVSFGHAAFFGIGGYVAGILASHASDGTAIFNWFSGSDQMLVIWPVAMLIAGLIALPIGIISLRTSGVYFIMITLAFAQMIYYFAISWPAYGGEDGLSLAMRNSFPGVNTLKPLSFFLIAYAVLMVVLFLFSRFRNSRFGAALEGARQNELRLSSVGIAPLRIRLVAFVLSAMITALAGALFVDLNRFVSPSMFSWHMSGELIVLIILGGTGRLFGPLIGAVLYVLFEFALGGMVEHWQLFFGLILLGVVMFARGGIIGLFAGKLRHG
ncbi:branched-chain amino acid ABC transporter permease [Bacillus subtilis]|uniref:branched-chain amino acid ABC transporter permease n=1 Tax=Pseudochrobactrum asaccharolyticum TaxID=354351 RepID=UPI001F1FD2AC|nr:branched-chain amino acid ABC transporter permease [Pseudochrobactrum asaccharolyticum]MCF7645245.1 branched-chain amino acid ABC transporter permease [Pseudochrobactrum asaccharolyticum]MCF7671857.1 branched-chain amino acid ABC transporter permease [Bacillus subtilis]